MNVIEYEHLGKLNEPFFNDFKASFTEVLESGWYILGDHVKSFESDFAAYCNTPFCAGVANGLDALILSLKALSLPSGSEVIVPSNTYIASILAVLHAGLKPVLVEPDLATYNIDPAKISEKITANTSAIMVVHLYGKCCDMPAIQALAATNELAIVEDCAQAHGASVHGQKAGTFGAFGAFSFYPTKNLGALGDGGAVTTGTQESHDRICILRNYGSSKKYHNEKIGFNSRLDEMQAAFLRIKLAKLDVINEHKRKLASLYLSGLREDFIKPIVTAGWYDVYHIFNVRHEKRDALKAYLLKAGIKTEIHYPIAPVQQVAMQTVFNGEPTPIATEIHASTLSLPISYFHTENDVAHVIEIMNKF